MSFLFVKNGRNRVIDSDVIDCSLLDGEYTFSNQVVSHLGMVALLEATFDETFSFSRFGIVGGEVPKIWSCLSGHTFNEMAFDLCVEVYFLLAGHDRLLDGVIFLCRLLICETLNGMRRSSKNENSQNRNVTPLL